MKTEARKSPFIAYFLLFVMLIVTAAAWAGSFRDTFEETSLSEIWKGDRRSFFVEDGKLVGVSAHPLMTFLRFIYVGESWTDYTVRCRVNVVQPNLLICTKGAMLLRYHDGDGIVFALHVAAKRVEVYRLSGEKLLSIKTPLKLKRWYDLRAEVSGNAFRFYLDGQEIGRLTDDRFRSGAVGLAVEDVMKALFDDFHVTGPGVTDIGTNLDMSAKVAVLWGGLKRSRN
jgi:hypothetical protein